jgi:hypothetical protein
VISNDEAAFQLSDTDDVTGLAFSEDRAGGFDIGGRDFQDFGSGVDDQAEQLVVQFHNENAILFVR